jgi:predicted transcriptional regulator of viral defense system
MNKIYLEFYQKKLFSLQEANKIIKDYQVCRNNICRLVKQKYLTKLKGGLYYITPLDNPEFYPDPIHIASKLRLDAVICANSALSVLKLRNIPERNITLASKHSSKIRIDEYTYKIIKNYNFGVDKIEYQTSYGLFELRVTDLERSILDCLRTRSVKAEELINIIKSKPLDFNFKRLLNYLEKYNMPILYNKAGLILELCKSNLKIDNDDIDKIRKKLTKKIYYFKERGIKLIRPKYYYFKEWNIMLPDHLFELAKTIRPITTVVK